MPRNLPEAVIQRLLLARLNDLVDEHGNRLCRVRRANTGVAQLGGRGVRFGEPGQADITGLLRGGRRLEVEVKVPGGRQSADQLAFQQEIESFGGLYILAFDVETPLQVVRQAVRS